MTSRDDRGGADPVAQRNACLLVIGAMALMAAGLVALVVLVVALLVGWRP